MNNEVLRVELSPDSELLLSIFLNLLVTRNFTPSFSDKSPSKLGTPSGVRICVCVR